MPRVSGSTEYMSCVVENIYKYMRYPNTNPDMYMMSCAVIGLVSLFDWVLEVKGDIAEYKAGIRSNINTQNATPPKDVLWSCRIDEISSIEIVDAKNSVIGNSLFVDCWDYKTHSFYMPGYPHRYYYAKNGSSGKYEKIYVVRGIDERGHVDDASDTSYSIVLLHAFLTNGKVFSIAQGVQCAGHNPTQRFLIKQAQLNNLIANSRHALRDKKNNDFDSKLFP